MTPIEDLVRQTFTDRERDMDDVPLPVPPARRSHRTAVVLLGAAAAAAVLVGSAVLVAQHRSDRTSRPAATDPPTSCAMPRHRSAAPTGAPARP